MLYSIPTTIRVAIVSMLFSLALVSYSNREKKFRVIAFYTAKNDLAHISFVHEANQWLPAMGKKYGFTYDSTNDWKNMNAEFLSNYDLIIFLDTRPEDSLQRVAFENYMEKGGAWMGFHFAAFALTPSAYPKNWKWYHEKFLGSGEYASNTWRPTSAVLRVENQNFIHSDFVTFRSAPNEWYRWENDLRKNPDIEIIASIDSSSFPLGTGPKQHEIWRSGYYPVVWRNKNYRMVYFNMGHNDMDYEGRTNKQLSSTFSSAAQDSLIIHAMVKLGRKPKK